ncbi:MAG: hypothetical protein DLM52_01155 [Chthoniobacterales bacterium]|nr:MAG: hypothetical protein DLM52_01155 [Chthoniobacterales bacterium]
MSASRTRKAENARSAQSLEQIPNIGPSIAQDLCDIGIKTPKDLIGDLPSRVESNAFRPTGVRRLGSVSWYTVTVKRGLEVKGEIVRVTGAVRQRLLRK